jgi:hypothetical protein
MSTPLTKKELNTLIHLAKKILWAPPEYRKILQDEKINIVPANFYSDIPLVDDINNSFEYKQANQEVYNSGDLFNRDRIAGFIEEVSKYSDEFNPPVEQDSNKADAYFWKNKAFSYSDAMAYYCVIRHFQPDHIVETGSGYSTLVADMALKKNGHGKLTLIEPYPMDLLKNIDTVGDIIEKRVQDIPKSSLIELLESSDVWFIDSTHTVKIGSDCLYIYLCIMPEINKDIIVHSHDIYLPSGFQKDKALNIHAYWTEQYLLYAYMLDNPKIEVLYGSAYASKYLPSVLDALMRGKYPRGGASLWYRLNGATGTPPRTVNLAHGLNHRRAATL